MANYSFPDGYRPILGAYFNLARSNFYKTVLSIFAQVGIPVNYQEDNIHDVLRRVYVLNNGTASDDDERKKYSEEKSLKLKPEQQMKMQRLLFHHFPLLQPIIADYTDMKLRRSKKADNGTEDRDILYGASFADCMHVISTIAECLKGMRNRYTHANPYNTLDEQAKEDKNQGQMAIWLEKAFEGSRRKVKTLDNLSDQDMSFLTGHGPNDRMKRIEDKEHTHLDKRLGKTVPNIKYVEREDYYYRIRLEKPSADGKLFVLSNFGTLYFCTLFLSMDYTKRILKELRLFEQSPYNRDGKKRDIILDMMCLYRIRIPRGKVLDSEDDINALALDIINELRRCPKELYDVLEEQGQEAFTQYSTSEQEWDEDIIRMIRHTDRFPQLVMKYIDKEKLFRDIRFQVRLGNFRFRFYDKQCVDGNTQVRSLQKEINGFGRIDEVEAKRKEKYADKIQSSVYEPTKLEHEQLYLDVKQFEPDSADSKPYITDHKASYNIHANRIGLWWKKGQGMYLPELAVTENGKAKTFMPAPTAELSVRDFPAMMFYHYLITTYKKDKRDSVEQIIENKTESIKAFFADIRDGKLVPYSKEADKKVNKQNKKELEAKIATEYGLTEADVPDKLWRYLFHHEANCQDQFTKSAIAESQRRYLQAFTRSKRFAEDKKKLDSDETVKYGKKGYHDVRHGKLAEHLAKSIMDWLPADAPARKKLTGLNYSKLQAFLATYGTDDGFATALFKLRRILESARLVSFTQDGEEKPAISKGLLHPFLAKVIEEKKPTNIESLYLNYLDAEVAHFKLLFAIDESDKDNPKITALKQTADWKSVPFVHAGRDKWKLRTTQYYQELASKYIADGATILLPDGLFTKPIRDFLKDLFGDNEQLMAAMANADTANNASFLIASFFRIVENDDNQPYYYTTQKDNPDAMPLFARRYELFDILDKDKPNKDKICPHGTVEEIAAALKPVMEDGKPKPVLGKKGKPQVDEQGNEQHVKVIDQAINQYVNHLETDTKHFVDDIETYQERTRLKLRRLLKDMKNNERAIRRYKTQDIVLFLMAKSILADITDKNNRHPLKHLKLMDICNGGEGGFLNATFPFEHTFSVTFKVPDKGGANAGSKGGKVVKKVKLVQEGLSLKNYGRFYRLLSDSRLKSLLWTVSEKQEKETHNSNGELTIDKQSLDSEFANYDGNRVGVFQIMQAIEDIAFAILKDEPDSEENNKKRDSFSALLSLLEDDDKLKLTEQQAKLLIEIRNAFGHNRYPVDVLETIPHLPEVANKVRARIDEILANTGINI